jgi:hypothetical protein
MSAVISSCGQYRYRLDRKGFGPGCTAIIMVNPSTADGTLDDATIRKIQGFGRVNEWGHLIVGNLFAYRATDVRELGKVDDPIGPENDAHLFRIACLVDRIIVAWGPVSKQPKAHRARWQKVMRIFGGASTFSIGPPAKCGHPKHPLMLPYSSPILPWSLRP